MFTAWKLQPAGVEGNVPAGFNSFTPEGNLLLENLASGACHSPEGMRDNTPRLGVLSFKQSPSKLAEGSQGQNGILFSGPTSLGFKDRHIRIKGKKVTMIKKSSNREHHEVCSCSPQALWAFTSTMKEARGKGVTAECV